MVYRSEETIRRSYPAVIALSLFLLSGCASTYSSRFYYDPAAPRDEIAVLDIDLDYAFSVSMGAVLDYYGYPDAGMHGTLEQGRLVVSSAGNMLTEGDIATIEPMLVKDRTNSDEYGMVLKIDVTDKAGNLSPRAGRFRGKFFASVDKILAQQKPGIKTFKDYIVLTDKGVAESMPPTAPVSYDAFRSYLDGREVKDDFEGIWADTDGNDVVGLIRNKDDAEYRYTGFIIESRRPNWRQGEIKLKLKDIQGGVFTTGICLLPNKAGVGAAFETGIYYIYVSNYPNVSNPLVLVREYPPVSEMIQSKRD